MTVRLIPDIVLPPPATGRSPALHQATPLYGSSGPVPPGYGRLVVILRCSEGQDCGHGASISLTPATGQGYIATIVPATAISPSGTPCWADVPAGSWTIAWDQVGGPTGVAVDILPGHVQGFIVDLPGGRPVGYP